MFIHQRKRYGNPDIHFNDGHKHEGFNLYKSCYNFGFAVVLVITRRILSYPSAVTEFFKKNQMIYYKHIN